MKKAGAKKRKGDDQGKDIEPEIENDDEEADQEAVVTGKDGIKTRGLSEALHFSTMMKAAGSSNEEREKHALDDMLCCLEFARRNLTGKVPDEEFGKTKAFLISLFLEHAWNCRVVVNGKAFTAYSSFRAEAQRVVYSAHQKIRFGQRNFNPLQLATDLLEMVKAPVRASCRFHRII